jgi:alanyl-tRNA synthetase
VTEKIYQADPAALSFDATTTAVSAEPDGRFAVELDRTCFYPGGGGQPADRGALGGIPVVEVIERDGRILHLLERAVPAGPIHGEVDAARRRDFMAQHTGQHIVSQALARAGNLETVSVHFGDEDTTIELKAGSVEERVLRAAEDLANAAIAENRRVILHEIDPKDAGRFPLRRTPPDVGRLRVVEVEGFDWAACGGGHGGSTAEIGIVKNTAQERIRGRGRLHVLIGRRAMDDYGRKVALVQDLCRALTCGEAYLRDRITEMLAREKETTRELRRLHTAQAAADADDSVSAARGIGGAVCVRRVFTATGADYLKAFVERVVATPGRICIAMDRAEESFQWIVAHSLGASFELADIVPPLFPIAGAKGGGRGERMQGVGAAPESIAHFADAIEAAIARILERSAP